jgi:hypothetical protein
MDPNDAEKIKAVKVQRFLYLTMTVFILAPLAVAFLLR